VKDSVNVVVNQPLPGLLTDVCGVIVDEYDANTPELSQAIIFDVDELAGQTLPVQTWCDILVSQGAEVIARYDRDYYAGKPAVTRNQFGQGQAIYLGAFGIEVFYDVFFGWLLRQKEIQSVIEAPTSVEVTERWQGKKRLLFVLNHLNEAQEVTLDAPCIDLLSGRNYAGHISIAPREVLILTDAM
jgi:beta-galactosidase